MITGKFSGHVEFRPTVRSLKEKGADAPWHEWLYVALEILRKHAARSNPEHPFTFTGPPAPKQILAGALLVHDFAPDSLRLATDLTKLNLVKLVEQGWAGQHRYEVDLVAVAKPDDIAKALES